MIDVDCYDTTACNGGDCDNCSLVKNGIPEGYTEIENVTGVFKSDSELVICGIPCAEDDNHDCDVMGCSSVSHVLLRVKL